jgi:uncharacterized protein
MKSSIAFLLLVMSSGTSPSRLYAQATSAPVQEEVRLTIAPGLQLPGTLLVPATGGPSAVVLIISGSGPTDRDGNSPALPRPNNGLRMLAEALAGERIATLRYDKRGLAQSAPVNEADLRFETYVDDAMAWIARLRGDRRFTHVVVAGHSEGSLVGMLAASRARVDGFVSIAGVARRASDVLRAQLRPQLATTPSWPEIEQVLRSLEAGTAVDPLPPVMAAVPGLLGVFRPSVQPYLISWFRNVPSTVMASLTMPVLIAQGTTDLQVGVDEAEALHAARPDAILLVIDGMNHVLKRAPADRQQNLATYADPNLPIVPELANGIAQLVKRIADKQ